MDYYGPRFEQKSSKRKRKNESTKNETKRHQDLDLTLYGHPCIRHRDDAVAIYFDNERHLINVFENNADEIFHSNSDNDDDYIYSTRGRKSNDLHGNPSNVDDDSPKLNIDRYDVRMHMELSSLHLSRNYLMNNNNVDPDADLTEEELVALNLERYLDLSHNCSEVHTPCNSLRERAVIESESSQLLDKIVDTMNDNNDIVSLNHSTDVIVKNERKSKDESFELNAVDKALLPKTMIVPHTKRIHDIILMTAKKAKDNPQFEVLLKVKQHNNPTFAFLDCAHELHAYYIWHRDGHGTIRKHNEKDVTLQNGALGTMGLYGSSSSDDDGDSHDEVEKDDSDFSDLKVQKNHEEQTMDCKNDMKPSKVLQSQRLSKEEIRKRRLEKAKSLKDHFSAKQQPS